MRKYNEAATAVMGELGVPVHDLHWVVEQGGIGTLLGPDGTHYTDAGSDRLAEAVVDCVLRQVTIRRYRPLPTPASGPEAALKYRESASRRDAQVPEAYRRLKVGEFRIPADAAAWKEQRPKALRAVVDSLGDLPPRPSPSRARIVTRELHRGYTLEKVAIHNGVDGEVTALLLLPRERKGPVPAILWLHSSTPDKTQVIIPGTNGGTDSLGAVFVRAGYAVLAPDSFWHGDRTGTGPSGTAESGRTEQDDLFKLNLWLGRTLWGMFVRDDQVALDYLCSRPEVDASRIGATGMSMGSTRARWLAAVDDRIAAVAAVACLTRYQNLIAHGELRQHGVYYFTNGLLKHFDTEGVLALIAPRPLLALTGDLDAGSPADGVRALERAVGGSYQAIGARRTVPEHPLSGCRSHIHTGNAGRGARPGSEAGCDLRGRAHRRVADWLHIGPAIERTAKPICADMPLLECNPNRTRYTGRGTGVSRGTRFHRDGQQPAPVWATGRSREHRNRFE